MVGSERRRRRRGSAERPGSESMKDEGKAVMHGEDDGVWEGDAPCCGGQKGLEGGEVR